jgi:hypothetical protein
MSRPSFITIQLIKQENNLQCTLYVLYYLYYIKDNWPSKKMPGGDLWTAMLTIHHAIIFLHVHLSMSLKYMYLYVLNLCEQIQGWQLTESIMGLNFEPKVCLSLHFSSIITLKYSFSCYTIMKEVTAQNRIVCEH